MSRLTDARNALEAYEATKPGEYQNQYKEKINGVTNQLDGMKTFDYDPTSDAAYTQYKNSYTRRAKLANENAQASASALSGGYGSSYGTQAGQSAYQSTMNGLNDALDGLYDQALGNYRQKKSDLQTQLSGYQQAEQQDYSRYQDDLNQWYNGLQYKQNEYNMAYQADQQKKQNRRGFWGSVLGLAASILPFFL